MLQNNINTCNFTQKNVLEDSEDYLEKIPKMC